MERVQLNGADIEYAGGLKSFRGPRGHVLPSASASSSAPTSRSRPTSTWHISWSSTRRTRGASAKAEDSMMGDIQIEGPRPDLG